MGRKSHSKSLGLWANGEFVGTWTASPKGDTLLYDSGWMQSAAGRPLSLSLPFPAIGNTELKGPRVRNYFDNLLPDTKAIRNRLVSRFKTESDDPFDLLAAIGRDCVGSLQLLPGGISPQGFNQIRGEVLSKNQIASEIRAAAGTGPTLGQSEDEELRISIAGAHEKTALLFHNNEWLRPIGATPTTHIMKLALGVVGNRVRVDMSTSVENEWLCARIFKHYGLPVATSHIMTFEDQKVLVVERFDRKMHSSGEWILRLPQEDICQAKGLPPSKKYESDGGPGNVDMLDLLNGSRTRSRDCRDFFDSQVLFWALAATDGHAKNFSLSIKPQGLYEMTPFYDILSMAPHFGKGNQHFDSREAKLAMAVRGKNKHYHLDKIQRRHFTQLERTAGIDMGRFDRVMNLIEDTPEVIKKVRSELPANYPESVSEPIFTYLQESMNRLERQPRD